MFFSIFVKLTSQNPYAEEYIGEPYVLTFNMNNQSEVREAVIKALKSHDNNEVYLQNIVLYYCLCLILKSENIRSIYQLKVYLAYKNVSSFLVK